MSDTIIDRMIATGFSSTELMDLSIDLVEEAFEGKRTLVDPTSPFIMSLEIGAHTAAAAMIEGETRLKQHYAELADEFSDLYYHMSDADYLGIFASYSTCGFLISLDHDEIYARAVEVAGTGTRKLILPKYTTVTISGVTFTMMYPIEIRIMGHGGLQIVYDLNESNVIESKDSNLIEWQESWIDNKKFITMNLQLPQLMVTRYYDTLNPSTGFVKSYVLKDQYYYAEVFTVYPNGTRKQMSITHSEIIYDAKVPTALVTYLDTEVKIEVPQIYFTNGTLGTKIEIVFYTTKGVLDMDMSDFIANSYSLTIGEGLSTATDGVYAVPFDTWSAMRVAGYGVATGGSDGISFDDLRSQVIDSGNMVDIPITEPQLTSKLSRKGYDIILSIDNIMRRVYLATRYLPANAASGFSTGASSMIATVQSRVSDLVKLAGVLDNGERITLTPDVVYNEVNGVVQVVSDAANPLNRGLALDVLAAEVNKNNYLYSPFHYVLDTTRNAFECRGYFLGSPLVSNRTFLLENDSTQIAVSSKEISLVRNGSNYKLYVAVKSGDTYKALPADTLWVQLGFTPSGETNRAFVNGTLVGVVNDDLVWEFDLLTNLDIDNNHLLALKNFTMFANQTRDFSCALEQEFELIYGVSSYTVQGITKSDIDLRMGKHLLDSTAIGVSSETVTLSLGKTMDLLWSSGRSVAGSETYLLHNLDVVRTYDKNVYVTNPVTGNPAISVDSSGNAVYEILHRAGEPKLDEMGEPVYLHRKGDVVKDENGVPIIATPRLTERQFDLLFIDGAYAFATHKRDVVYRNTLAETIYGFMQGDLATIGQTLHEKTELYFYPKKSLGKNSVIVDSGRTTAIDAALSFQVRYYLNSTNYSNLALREQIKATTSEVINQELQKATVSVDGLTNSLRARLGTDVGAIDLEKLGADRTIPAYTAIDDATRCSVKRKLKVLPEGVTIVVEDIVVDFVKHSA